ncbi:MAG: DUF6282 family protein [Planctomycetota bacterium]
MDLTHAIDLHLHTAPDVFPRSVTEVEAARDAQNAGMRAILLKSHHVLTADRARLARDATGFPVFGGLALNLPTGGLNPVAVETAIAFGARQIWMPTMHAQNCLEEADLDMFGAEAVKGVHGIRVLDPDGQLLPGVFPILEMIRDADIILGTGHLTPAESLAVLRAAQDMGLRRLLMTHPQMDFTRASLGQMRAAVDLGAFLELDALSCKAGWPGALPPSAIAQVIREVRPQHVCLASDGGQAVNPRPVQMLGAFAEALAQEGIPSAALGTMLCENPAFLLSL